MKDYTSKFQERMILCENDRDELKAIEKQHMEDTEVFLIKCLLSVLWCYIVVIRAVHVQMNYEH